MGDMLSQEEIDALLKGTSNTSDSSDIGMTTHDDVLDENEKDALGEIGNISMGTSATTLFTLLGQKVTITTPQVTVTTFEELGKEYPVPFVAVEVEYKEGLLGTNLLILKENDVKIITDLMMGGDGSNFSGELTELHLSAISEAMNQMVGSSSTSLSEMFHKKIDICPPKAAAANFSKEFVQFDNFSYSPQDKIVKVAFRMVIGDIIDSEIMQIIPVDFAKNLVSNLFSNATQSDYVSAPASAHKNTEKEPHRASASSHSSPAAQVSHSSTNEPPTFMGESPNTGMHVQRNQPVNVQPVQFQSFEDQNYRRDKESISLIRDVPLEITVELGRTTKKISEILEFSSGTVIELDRLVGEPLDILVNGQFVAKGEVVVIDENYGIRITDILNPAKQLNKFK
ncbi:MAG: flagellar motor switch phosphatase FliY [Bacillota bacterium]